MKDEKWMMEDGRNEFLFARRVLCQREVAAAGSYALGSKIAANICSKFLSLLQG
jgi:hypothetical protein